MQSRTQGAPRADAGNGLCGSPDASSDESFRRGTHATQRHPPPTAAVPVGGAPGGKGKRDVFFWDQKTTLQREAQAENVTVDSTVELSKLKGNPGCAHGPRPRAQEKPRHTRGAAAAGARYTYRVTLAV